MDKNELYNLLKEKPNGNVQENIFKKKFPIHYELISQISFPNDFTFQQKLYHYLNDDINLILGICPVCGNRCKYRRINEGYNSHCSTKCSSIDETVKNKLVNTNLERYGFEYSSKNENVKNKLVNTNLKKYGVDNPMKIKAIKDKVVETNLKKYGKPNFSQTNYFSKYHKKRILYNNIYFDSSWEVDLYKYCKMNNIHCVYQPNIIFEYTYNNRTHTYQPDFLINGKLYEVKGNHFFDKDKMINPYDRNMDDLFESKHQCMILNNVIILREDEIKNLDKVFKNE